jgi:hypothetical protein
MKKIRLSEYQGRNWLSCQYDGKTRDFAYPLVQGTHQECYEAITRDKEIVPAERLDLALLAYGAFSSKEPLWQEVKQKAFINGYLRVPMRLLWIPKGNKFSGVLIERDLQGKGLTEKMQIPENMDEFEKTGRFYSNADGNRLWVPNENYKSGKHSVAEFENNGFANAVLTEEGCEIFAKTASDNNKNLCIWTNNDKVIQRVPAFILDEEGLYLVYYGWGNDLGNGCAAGIKKSSKKNSPKIN